MNDELFEWDDANILHVAEHAVTPEEAEEALLNRPMEMGYDKSDLGEDRWSYLGETAEGRVLYVAITMRGERVRIATAFEPIKRLKLMYLAYKAEYQ
ncbi:MAG TPA: BrnT family toxin [Terracidiphilus sp.]|nr:BrnT family toxin [Terracidiphilus sp.]